MNDFFLYLLKSACWLTGFTIVYFVFLRNERFFLLKRIFLISGILISFLFPLISVHYQIVKPAPLMGPFNMSQEIGPVQYNVQQDNVSGYFNLKNLLIIMYIIGMIVLAFRMIKNIFRVLSSAKRNKKSKDDTAVIIRDTEYPSSFSFFNYVFINASVKEDELMEIMNHELVHVKQKHWFDLLLGEFLRLVQWVNPFAWIYTGFIRLNNEYLADEAALLRSANPAIYKAALLNQMFRSPVISLSNSFNYSLNNTNRFEMMKKIITSPYRRLKVLLVIPVFAIVFYAFAEPVIKYDEPASIITTESEPVSIPDESEILTPAFMPDADNKTATTLAMQKGVKGVVLKEDGTPFPGVPVLVTGIQSRTTTDSSGNFDFPDVPESSRLVFSYRGYLTQIIPPQFSGQMTITLARDPGFKEQPVSEIRKSLVVIDDVISEKPFEESMKEVNPNQIGQMTVLKSKDATDKYGEKGKNGVIEILTKKRAAELGIKVPFRRRNPDDYPTFQGGRYSGFSNYIMGNLKYPEEATANGIEGEINANFTVEADGTVSNIRITGPDPILRDAVEKAIMEAPQWEPAKNPEARTPFGSSFMLQFQLPDKIIQPEIPFVVVEEMPMYPGGDQELLNFIKNNVIYPEEAKQQKIEGRVILRFAVTSRGDVDHISVLKGVDPLLDNEAIRVASLLKGFSPGRQGGKPVPVWYMVPVTFSLGPDAGELEKLEQPATSFTPNDPMIKPDIMPQYPGGDAELLKQISENTIYPQAAKDLQIQGRVIVRFVITSEGKVKDATVLKGVDPSLDTEAIKAVYKLSDFTPAMKDGKPMATYYMIPVTFTVK